MYEIHQGGCKPAVECSRILNFFRNLGPGEVGQKPKRQITVIHSTEMGLKILWHRQKVCVKRICMHPNSQAMTVGVVEKLD